MFNIITRTKLAKCSGGIFTRKMLANWDSQGIGFDHKLVNDKNGQVAYYLDDVKKYIRDNYRVVTKAK